MKRSAIKVIMTALVVLLGSAIASGQNLTGPEIMSKNDQQRKSRDERVELTMKLINKRGKARVRKIMRTAKTDAADNEKSLIRFLSPADVKGTGLLTIEHAGRDDDQWLYLPALRKVRRISASDQSDSFMGSDFAYEDLGSEDLELYHYTLLKEEAIGDDECYVIQAVPTDEKEKKESGYSKRLTWVRKDNFVGVRVEFYDKKGELLKVLKSSDIRTIPGADKWRAHRMDMENLKTGHKTVLVFENYEINQGASDRLFTQRHLERGR